MAVQIAAQSQLVDKQREAHQDALASVFGRLVVVLDSLAPERGAFMQSLDWAERLRLPLSGVIGTEVERVRLCASACERSRVAFEAVGSRENCATTLAQIVGSGDLLAFGHSLPPEQKKKLLHMAMGQTSPAILICPNHTEPLSRILLLDQGSHSIGACVRAAVEICGAFRAKLIVLTVARSTKEGHGRQQAAVDALAKHDLDADFDLIMGSEVRAAVVCVASWRRCQLVIMGRHVSRSWWRWLRDPAPDWFLNLVEPLCYLSVPERT